MVAVILATHLMTPVAAYLVRSIGDPSGAEQSGEDPGAEHQVRLIRLWPDNFLPC